MEYSEDNKQEPLTGESSGNKLEEEEKEVEEIQLKDPPLPATFGLIILIALVYGVTCFPTFQRPARWAIEMGAYYSPSIVINGEWWRLITPNLMHWNLGHILSNGFGLWVFGRMIEPLMGTRNMIYLFVISGLSSSLAMLTMDTAGIYWQSDVPAIVAGASGIDYGVMAAAFTILLLVRRRLAPEGFTKDLRGMVVLLLVYTYLNLSDGHLAIFAHLGGFLGGLAFALAYYRLLTQKARKNPYGWGIDTKL